MQLRFPFLSCKRNANPATPYVWTYANNVRALFYLMSLCKKQDVDHPIDAILEQST